MENCGNHGKKQRLPKCETGKGNLLRDCYTKGVSNPLSLALAETQRQAEEWESFGKRGSLPVCPDWRRLAWGSYGRLPRSTASYDWLEVRISLSQVGPKLEVGTKIREAVSY